MEKMIVIELTEAELALVMKKREEDARQNLLENYIAEFNDLITRAKVDGFTFATPGSLMLHSATSCHPNNKNTIMVK
jgi:hypothetical protein